MSCENPILAVSIMKNADSKHVLKFIPRSEIEKISDLKFVYGSDEVFLLPCMKCKSCRSDYAKDWAVRCTLEAQMHPYNYFLTLTYDDYHILKASKKDFTSFLKSLGYFLTGKPNRPLFFACEEKGELTQRLHFHCVLFLDKELELHSPAKIGDFYHYTCDKLTELWSCGFVDVAPFESDCARYVAKYSTKTGNCFMSRNLGKSYFLKYHDEIISDDFKVYGSFFGKEYVDIPKSFVRYFLEEACEDIEKYRLNKKDVQRLLVSNKLHSFKCTESRLIKENILLILKHDKFARERSEL